MFSLEDFLNLTDENKERFKEIILDHIDENEDIRKGVSTELLEESLKSIKNLKWSIDSEKLSIYWDQYEIAIGATGNIQLSIPLDEINFLLTDKARKNLYQPDIEENNVHKMVKQQPREQLNPSWILIGTLGGTKIPHFDIFSLMRKRIQLTGTGLTPRSDAYKAALSQELITKTRGLFENGTMKAIVDTTFNFEDVKKAHDYMEANKNTGKIILTL